MLLFSFGLWLFQVLFASASVAPGPSHQFHVSSQDSLPREIVGNVTDYDGGPLAGATVMLADDRRSAVITNSTGKFLLLTKSQEPQLRVSAAGYYDTLVVVKAPYNSTAVQLRIVDRYRKKLKKKYKATKKAWRKP